MNFMHGNSTDSEVWACEVLYLVSWLRYELMIWEKARLMVALLLKIEQLQFFSSVKHYFINACDLLRKVLTNNSDAMFHVKVVNLRGKKRDKKCIYRRLCVISSQEWLNLVEEKKNYAGSLQLIVYHPYHLT
jgi:hypothetical protein